MEHPIEQRLTADIAFATRARLVSLLGPTVVAAGFIWAILQPDRVTLLHPHGRASGGSRSSRLCLWSRPGSSSRSSSRGRS